MRLKDTIQLQIHEQAAAVLQVHIAQTLLFSYRQCFFPSASTLDIVIHLLDWDEKAILCTRSHLALISKYLALISKKREGIQGGT